MKPEIINDLISTEENCEARGINVSKMTFSASLLEVPEEVKTNLNFPPLWGFTSVCGRRPEMEDTVIALPRFLTIPSPLLTHRPIMNVRHQDLKAHFFGVYDGHGGQQERDVNEESGWKLVHGDVFRTPLCLVLLSALVGTAHN
ncbi:unnamed protein product [Fraxinus pennsylvanica]|uniref:Uncharacterized protein n=1 Tax=Fraxinus pennsylvanica TaxID=56036 RepID=A0AAD2E3S9_9LAMI|nr:unnamed protein product [Fraxinus pennsylvanica]